MLVNSLIDNKQWLWVNIPKTATTSVMKTFFPEKHYTDQSHHTYYELIHMYGIHPAFTVVRNPIDRLLSGLNHICNVCECQTCIIHDNHLPTTEDVIYFLRDLFILKKNIPDFFNEVYKNATNDLYLHVINLIKKNFSRTITIGNSKYCTRWTCILPQTHQLQGTTDIRIFKYEHIEEFYKFMEVSLGYTMQPIRYRQYPNKLMLVDKQNSTLRSLIYEFHKNDFINYGYII